MTGKPAIEKLRQDHPVDAFDCGKDPLNRFLARHALQNQQMGASQTYVAVSDGQLIGYYTLVFGEVAPPEAPERLRKGAAQYPVPLMVLARLAVATDRAGHGVGSGLLKDAMLRTLQAADIAGLRALAVHAKDDEARAFYEHFDFIASPTDPMHLFVLLKDVRALLGGPG
ncbi:GNAT family N-acetyltransferase [Phenylobacterium sp.]|uniref:GNAT family N-acetyltransferase n=1 Tax=Phenylobacterium sp. TaxID=1871053 RepID=UPI0025DD4FF4|nr:GNAT family N-acetyltransferase [Phenylobacterium sp.]MBX3486005.1 GNAT family N-acetyltransferase [Phenylobacterium sp.]